MTAKQRQGGYLTYTPSANLAPLTIVPMVNRVAIYPGPETAVTGVPCTVRTCDIWPVACLSTDVVAQDALLYWDNTNKRLTLSSSGNALAGKATTAKAAGVATVEIELNANGPQS